MSQTWHLEKEEDLLILTCDTPDRDVNVLSMDNMGELENRIDDIQADSKACGLIIRSKKKKIFIAGADIKEIETITSKKDAEDKAREGKRILQKLENLQIPTLSVINGACLGGGCELALATDYRVGQSGNNIKIGLPEVNLGILPGFGGCLRLPKLIGLKRAMPLILGGKILTAKDAYRYGLLDHLYPETILLTEAKSFLRNIIKNGYRRKKPKSFPAILEKTGIGRKWIFNKAKESIIKKTKGFYPAPLKALEVIEKTYAMDVAKASQTESSGFAELAVTEVSKNLIKLFFLSEKYKKFSWVSSSKSYEPVKKCGVVGAGVMGGGIAQLTSSKNIATRIKDINLEAISGAYREAYNIYKGALKRRKISKSDFEYKMNHISSGLTNTGLGNADFIIEAVVENLEIKKKVFKELDQIAKKEAILATNTSSLPVTEMAKSTEHPERVIGIHFFNPVHRMPLIEIIKTEYTTDDVLDKTVQFARRLGKTVVVVKDVYGFYVNRILLPYLNEAAYLLEEGLSMESIDDIATEFGLPMGPITLADQVGIDVGYKVAKILEDAFGERMKVAKVLDSIYAKGLLGKKSGSGFYTYKGDKKIVNSDVQTLLKNQGDQKISRHDALKRMIYIMVNESARALEEGVIDSPGSCDIAMIMGTGFPPHRSGLLRFADQVGISNIVKDLDRFESLSKKGRFVPSDYLVKLAKEDAGFYSK